MHQDRIQEGATSFKELWIQESYRKKEFQLVSVDTLLNWADIGTKATDATTRWRGAEAGVGMSSQVQ